MPKYRFVCQYLIPLGEEVKINEQWMVLVKIIHHGTTDDVPIRIEPHTGNGQDNSDHFSDIPRVLEVLLLQLLHGA